MKTKTKKIIILIISILILLSGGVLFYLLSNARTNNENVVVQVNDNNEVVLDDNAKKLIQDWKDNKAINKDYVGEIMFDSGLLRQSFVQAKSVYDSNGDLYHFYTQDGQLVSDPEDYNGNDVYIWTYWKTQEYDFNDNGGSTFLDFRNDLSDQNLIIYGHHFSVWNDINRNKAFTPLEKLLEEKNYEDNKYVSLVLENEIRRYELSVVYEFNAYDEYYYEKCQYWRYLYNYDDYNDETDENYYQKYIDAIEEVKLYDTGVKLSPNDKTLTLQTCISGHTGELFEILVFKQIDSINLP